MGRSLHEGREQDRKVKWSQLILGRSFTLM